jgi:hypothetical protein
MSVPKQRQVKPAAARRIAPSTKPLVQRKCGCGKAASVTGKCAECGSDRMLLQRRAGHRSEPAAVPSIVHDVLRSPGTPLDSTTRSFMDPRFGYDFSRVRVHTDAMAAESARAVNARSYTVGPHVVFDAGEYHPGSTGGKRLLAHELAHVIQQGDGSDLPSQLTLGSAGSDLEREADDLSERAINAPEPKKPGQANEKNAARTDVSPGDEDPRQRVDPEIARGSGAGDRSDGGNPRPAVTQRHPGARGVIQRAVTNLAVAGAVAEAGQANHFVTARGAGRVTITATVSAAGQRVNWTGGIVQPGNNLQRVVLSAPARTVNITADTPVNPGPQNVTIHIVNGRVAPAAAPARVGFSRQAGVPPGLPGNPALFGLTDVRTNNPVARIRAGLAGNQWAFRVERINHRFILGTQSRGRTGINRAGDATRANHCRVITDLTPPAVGVASGPPRANFWSPRITQRHEEAHVARFYSPPFWEAFMRIAEANIEAAAGNVNVNHAVPATMSATAVVTANAGAHQAIINAQHAAADAAEIVGAETFAHDQSNPMYTTLVAQIAAHFKPLAPTGLAAVAGGPQNVQLNWNHNACNETEYRVFRRRGLGAFQQIATLPAGSIAFLDTLPGLVGNTRFTYFVAAAGVAGQSDRSNQVVVNTP